MTVKELIAALAGLNQDMEVIIQQDSEGNGYHKAYAVDVAWKDKHNDYPSCSTDEEELNEMYGDNIPNEQCVVIV